MADISEFKATQDHIVRPHLKQTSKADKVHHKVVAQNKNKCRHGKGTGGSLLCEEDGQATKEVSLSSGICKALHRPTRR